MKMTKKIISILLSCLMLMSLMAVPAFAAAGDQNEPINANDKWFGYGVDCFLMNTTLADGDADGVWYELTADADGILQLEHSIPAEGIAYQINAWVNGTEYHAYENGAYNRPIATYPVAIGDVIIIQVIAQDPSVGGLVYLNAKFIGGTASASDTVKVKSAPSKLYVAAGQTVYFQDDSLQAEYAAQYVNLTGDSVEDVQLYTVTINASTGATTKKGYTDTDGDGAIEIKMGGSEGSAGSPAVKPAWAIENNSGEDRCFVLTVVDEAHECNYDDDADADCNTCGTIREVAPVCQHEYIHECDTACSLCGEVTRPEATCQGEYPCSYACKYCLGLNPNPADHVSNAPACQNGACTICSGFVAATTTCEGEYPCSYACKYCLGLNPNPADHVSNAPACQNSACTVCSGLVEATAEHEYFADCDSVCMNCYEETRAAAHNVIHMTAKDATCTETGNVEFWYCDACGAAWLDADCTIVTNMMAVKTGASCKYGAEYHEGAQAGCHYNGMNEYWYCATCDMFYADAACTIVTNYKSLIIPATQTSAEYVPAKDATCTEAGNTQYWVCYECEQVWADEALTQLTNIKNVKIAPSCKYGAEYHEGAQAGCHYNGMNEYWYCATCDVFYADADCTIVTNYKNLVIPALQDSAEYVPAKTPTCTEAGNTQYWVCYECEQVWADEALTQLTNIKNVKIAPSCSYGAEYHEGVEAGCHYNGMAEYWYCANCDVFYADADCTIVTNYKNLVIPALQDSAEYVPAKDATCTEIGNTQYWVCYECEQVWADEALTQLTNIKNVKTGYAEHEYFYPCDATCMNCGEFTNENAAHSMTYVDAKAPTCTEAGNIAYYTCEYCGGCWDNEQAFGMPLNRFMVMLFPEHTYTDDYDTECDACGDIRVVEYDVITFGGNSYSEDVSGLAFKFEVSNANLTLWAGTKYKIQYSNCTVTPDSTGEYKLVRMGAVVSNDYGITHLDYVDGEHVIDIKASTVVGIPEGAPYFAVRVINIPESAYDTEVTARPYYIYEDAEGNQITIYGEEQTATVNGAKG